MYVLKSLLFFTLYCLHICHIKFDLINKSSDLVSSSLFCLQQGTARAPTLKEFLFVLNTAIIGEYFYICIMYLLTPDVAACF